MKVQSVPLLKKLSFVNSSTLVHCILNEEEIFSISSHESSSGSSSDLNFSTFRSEDFPSFMHYSRLSIEKKTINQHKLPLWESKSGHKKLNFRNSSKTIKKILHHLDKNFQNNEQHF